MIRVGLLGASRVSRYAVIEPAAGIDGIDVTSVAARDAARAVVFAEEHGIPNVEEDYRSLVSSDAVDLVYNGLPPASHARWSIAALEAGKHVLCEKPFALNAEEAQTMVDAATRTGKFLIEAYHYRFHPLFDRVLELLARGSIGAVRELDAHFNVPIEYHPGEIRYDAALGGGAMMDLGCYCVHWVRSIMGSEPEVLAAAATRHESGVDVGMDATLEFSGGVRATLSSSMAEDLPQGRDARLRIIADRGTLTVDNPVAPHAGNELVVQTEGGSDREEVAGDSTYTYQLRHVLGVLAGTVKPLTGGDDAVATMRVMDRIYQLSGLRPG